MNQSGMDARSIDYLLLRLQRNCVHTKQAKLPKHIVKKKQAHYTQVRTRARLNHKLIGGHKEYQ
jgi:hypothetical protein